MSNQCEACSAPTDLYLCRVCVTTLRENLTALVQGPYVRAVGGRTKTGGTWHIERRTPGLLANLEDVVLKRTRMGNGSGHRKRGDELPAPFEPDIAKQGRNDQPVLTTQGRADQLLIAAQNTLSTIIRDLCESRGGTPRTVGAKPVDMAAWLIDQVHTIACDETAGQCFSEIDAMVRQSERLVDRPVTRKWLGSCPSWDERQRKACGAQLYAPEDAIEVYCRVCRTTHNCNRLRLLMEGDLEREPLTWDRLLKANKMLPDEFRVPVRTLQSWRRPGRNGEPPKLKVRYLRPDEKSWGNSRQNVEDVEVFLWADVRKLRAAKPQKVATGAASRRSSAR